MNIFSKLKQGLSKTSKILSSQLSSLLAVFSDSDDFFEELEETLILADLGPQVSMDVVTELRVIVRDKKLKSGDEIFFDVFKSPCFNLLIMFNAYHLCRFTDDPICFIQVYTENAGNS